MLSTLLRSIRVHDHQVGEDIRSLWRGTEAIGFWAAIVLPLAYPVVAIGGGWLSGSWTPLVGLVAAHSMALIVGRGHGRRISEGRTDGE
jgi:hypothetical protein